VPRSADRPRTVRGVVPAPRRRPRPERRHRRGHQPPHALARPCQNLPEIPGIRQIGQPWHGALRRPVIEPQTVMRLVQTASAFPENADGELHQVAERRTGEEPGPPLAELAAVDPLPDVEHLADVRCPGGSRCAGASSAGPRMGKRRAPVEAGISQPRRDPAELLPFGDIFPGGNHPEQPRHDGTRVRPRCSAISAGSAPARTAATSSSSSSRLHRAPRGGTRSITGTLGSRAGGHARIMLPCAAAPQEASCRDRHRPAACWNLLEGVRTDDTDPAATRRPSSAT
jgi:hypothetical protein